MQNKNITCHGLPVIPTPDDLDAKRELKVNLEATPIIQHIAEKLQDPTTYSNGKYIIYHNLVIPLYLESYIREEFRKKMEFNF